VNNLFYISPLHNAIIFDLPLQLSRELILFLIIKNIEIRISDMFHKE